MPDDSRALFDALLDEIAAQVVGEPPPSARDREVLYRRVVLGEPPRVIAVALGCTAHTVSARLDRATWRLGIEGVPRLVSELSAAYSELIFPRMQERVLVLS